MPRLAPATQSPDAESQPAATSFLESYPAHRIELLLSVLNSGDDQSCDVHRLRRVAPWAVSAQLGGARAGRLT